MPTPPTRRGQKTKDRILASTADLLARNPVAAVSLDRIASASGVAKSSVLWHWGGKETLFLAVVQRAFATLEAELVADEPKDVSEQLPRFFRAYEAFLAAHPEVDAILFRLLFATEADSDVRRAIVAMYQGFRASIVAHTRNGGEPLSESQAALVIAMVDGLFLQAFIDPTFDLAGSFAALQEIVG